MNVSDVVRSFKDSHIIARSTVYAHMKKGIHSIDDDIFQKIKQRWYNGRWHYAQMLTVQDVALALHLSRNTVYRLLHFKKIRSVKINNQYFISKRHLVDFEKKVKVRERRSL